MKPIPSTAHLWPALAALLTVAIAFGGVEASVRWRLPAEMDRFAATMAPVKLTGNALQTAAFRTPGILPIYGSSELDRPAENRPDAFFRQRPTGFSVFPIGKAGNTCLILLEKLAAAGGAVRGKKVAIFLSPTWFLRNASADAVASNLRPLQVGCWVFGGSLSTSLRCDIARRLEAFPDLFTSQPLLASALRDLAEDSWWNRLHFALLSPLGRAQNFLLARAEYLAILRDLPGLPATHRQRVRERRQTTLAAPPFKTPDWPRLAAEGEAHDRALGDTSPFSVGAPTRDEKRFHAKSSDLELAPPFLNEAAPESDEMAPATVGSRDEDFATKMIHSSEWTDLALLLRTLHELGADALLICQPFNGRYRDAGGNTPGARRAFYDRLHATVQRAGYPFYDFAEHEEDRTFFSDSGHPSAKAWIFYNHALNDFYQERKMMASAPAP